MTSIDRVARRAAELMSDALGGEEDWFRADVLANLASMCKGYEMSEVEALVDEWLNQCMHWETFADY